MKCGSGHSSLASVGSNSGSNGPDSAAQSGRSSGTSSAGARSSDVGQTSSGSMTSAASVNQLSLMSISSAVASPAKMCPARERALALLESARGSGLSLPGSSPKWAPPGSSLKTSRVGLRHGLTGSVVTWESSAFRLYRSHCQRRMSELRTFGVEFSLLPVESSMLEVLREMGYLPTPTAKLADGGNGYHRPTKTSWRPTLTGVFGCAATPLLPTPNATGGGSNRSAAWVGLLPTPIASGANRGQTGNDRHPTIQEVTGQRGRLCPLFVEWMMGFPIGWTGSGPLETPSSPSAPRSSDGSSENSPENKEAIRGRK